VTGSHQASLSTLEEHWLLKITMSLGSSPWNCLVVLCFPVIPVLVETASHFQLWHQKTSLPYVQTSASIYSQVRLFPHSSSMITLVTGLLGIMIIHCQTPSATDQLPLTTVIALKFPALTRAWDSAGSCNLLFLTRLWDVVYFPGLI
jgi:hypothetical protein